MKIGNILNNTITKYLKTSEFRKNVVVIASGAVASQLLNFTFSPILSRLYSPQEFGSFALFTSIVAIVSILATGGYELAISLPKKDDESVAVSALTLTTTSLVSIASFILLVLFRIPLQKLLPGNAFIWWAVFIPIGVFLTGSGQAFYYHTVYRKGFKKISANNVTKVLASNVSQLLISLTKVVSTGGLILGQLLGQLVSTASYAIHIWGIDKQNFLKVSSKDLLSSAKRFKKFPMLNQPAMLINVIANQIPIILLSSMYGLGVTGQYSLTQKVLGVPSALIGTSILTVFKERASRDFRENNTCRDIYIKTLKALAKVSIIPFLIVFVSSRQLIPFIFGQEWQVAGNYAKLLSVMFLFRFVASPLSYVLVVAEKQKVALIWQTCLLLVSVISFLIGQSRNNPDLGILIFSLTYTCLYIIMILLTYKYSEGRGQNELR